jgi:hypothetical protein
LDGADNSAVFTADDAGEFPDQTAINTEQFNTEIVRVLGRKSIPRTIGAL